MLLPDNIHPSKSIYYNGAQVLIELFSQPKLDFFELYYSCILRNEMSLTVFQLSLDWLFLLGLIQINSQQEIELCILNH